MTEIVKKLSLGKISFYKIIYVQKAQENAIMVPVEKAAETGPDSDLKICKRRQVNKLWQQKKLLLLAQAVLVPPQHLH